MDEDQTVADYLQAAGDTEPDVQLISQKSDWAENRYAEPGSTSQRGFPFIPVLVLVLVVTAGFGGWRMYQQHMQEKEASRVERDAAQVATPSDSTKPSANTASQLTSPQPAPPVENTQPAAAVQQPVPSPVANGASSTPATTSGFEVEVKTTGRAWVSLRADGKILVRGVLDADQARTLRADKEIVVWTGNAGATQVSFEGKPVPMEGGVNEPKVLVFKPNGLQPSPPPAGRPTGISYSTGGRTVAHSTMNFSGSAS